MYNMIHSLWCILYLYISVKKVVDVTICLDEKTSLDSHQLCEMLEAYH